MFLEGVERDHWYDRSSHQRCSIKKLFLKILQYLQENTYVEVSLY